MEPKQDGYQPPCWMPVMSCQISTIVYCCGLTPHKMKDGQHENFDILAFSIYNPPNHTYQTHQEY